MHLGSAIRHIRELLQLKIELVAQEAGFAPSNLSRIETGKQNPSIPRLEAIARAMEVSVADIYALIEPPRSFVTISSAPNARGRSLDQSEWIQLRHGYENLDARNRRLVLELLQMLLRQQIEESDSSDAVAYTPTLAMATTNKRQPVAPSISPADVLALLRARRQQSARV